MASELTITIWSEGPADNGLAYDLGATACQAIFNQSGGSHRAWVVNAKAFDMPIEFVRGALPVEDAPTTTPTAPAVPPIDPLAAPEPDVSNASPFELPPTPLLSVVEPVTPAEPATAEVDVASAVVDAAGSAVPVDTNAVVSSLLVAGAVADTVDTAEAVSHASAEDNAAAAGAPVEVVSPSVVEVIYPKNPSVLSYANRAEQEAALEAQLADLQAQDAAAVDANGSAS